MWRQQYLYFTLTCIQEVFCASIMVAKVERSDACSSFPSPQLGVIRTISTSAEAKKSTVPHNNGTNDSTEWDLLPLDSNSTSKSPVRPRAITDQEWRTAVYKGAALWNQLQHVLSDPWAMDAVVCGLDDRWDVWSDTAYAHKLPGYWYQFLPYNAIPVRQPGNAFTRVDITAPKLPTGFNRAPSHTGYYYENTYSPTYGMINVLDVVGKISSESSPRVTRAPDRWSDVTWAYWKTIAASEGKDPRSLTYILQQAICNEETQNIQKKVLSRTHGELEDRQPYLTILHPGTEEFDALLRSPNVIGTVYMLIRKANEIGRKTIKRIGNYRRSEVDYNLWIELEDVLQDPGTISSA